MQRENALDADAEVDATHRKGGAGSAAFFGNYYAFKSLEALFFLLAFAFFEANVHANAVAGAKLGQIFAQLRFMQFLNYRIHCLIPCSPAQTGLALKAQSVIIVEFRTVN